MSPLVIPVVAAVVILIGHLSPTPERVILLPDVDGQVGQLVVRSATSQQVLDKAYAASEIDASGNIAARSEDAASVQARYGTLLDARPPRPISFTLYFLSGSAQELTPESIAVLEQLKAAIANRPLPEITVIGHTDRVGSLAQRWQTADGPAPYQAVPRSQGIGHGTGPDDSSHSERNDVADQRGRERGDAVRLRSVAPNGLLDEERPDEH